MKKKIKTFFKILISILILLFILVVVFIAINNARADDIVNKVAENDDKVFKVTSKVSATNIESEIYNSKDVIYVKNNIRNENQTSLFRMKKDGVVLLLSDNLRLEGDNSTKKTAVIAKDGIMQASPIAYAKNFNSLLPFENYMEILKNDFSFKNLLLCFGNYFTSAKWISEEEINGIECYKISVIFQTIFGFDYSIYISKDSYMPIRVCQGQLNDDKRIIDFEYSNNVDQSKMQFPDLSDYYVTMQ